MKTSALDGGEWSALTPLPLYPWGNSPQYSLYRQNGLQSQSGCYEEKNLALARNGTPAVQPVACRYTG
jgi:hypothetical protein